MARRHVDDLDVRAADPARFDLDEHLAGSGFRLRDITDGQSTIALEDRGAHPAGHAGGAARGRRAGERRVRPRASPAIPKISNVAKSITVPTALTSGVTPNLTFV